MPEICLEIPIPEPPLEMLNLLDFSMGKLPYDLLLEVIDELDPNDVPELWKVNKIFRAILLQKPVRIFGKQIYSIDIDYTERGVGDDYVQAFIKKFRESTLLSFNLSSHDVFFFSQVERSSILCMREPEIVTQDLSEVKKILANLKQVNELRVGDWHGTFIAYLENFKAEVTDQAFLPHVRRLEAEVPLLLLLINRSLQNCKTIFVELFGNFDEQVLSALAKTQLELLVIHDQDYDHVATVGLIMKSGIPSENKEAACYVEWHEKWENKKWFQTLPGIDSVNERTETFIGGTMRGILAKHKVELLGYSDEAPIHCYSKRIDEDRDCIYVLSSKFFFAKHVSSGLLFSL